jgi:hypothetical protein
MQDDEEYLRRASEADQQAERSTDPQVRAKWHRLANYWLGHLGRALTRSDREAAPPKSPEDVERREPAPPKRRDDQSGDLD